MKRIGVIIFLIANIFMFRLYVKDIIKYYWGRYNYDGIRYLIPLTIADILFLISLTLLVISIGFKKRLWGFIVLALLHNVIIGIGVENIPFAGTFIVIISFVYSARYGFIFH